jgi:hypothetical protein
LPTPFLEVKGFPGIGLEPIMDELKWLRRHDGVTPASDAGSDGIIPGRLDPAADAVRAAIDLQAYFL